MRWDFLVSCVAADLGWGEWVAWEIESRNRRVRLEAWDARPGTNRVHSLHDALRSSGRMVVVVSPSYLADADVAGQWHAVWQADPLGVRRSLVPVLVAPCEPDGLLRDIRPIDLVGSTEEEARIRLAEELEGTRPRAPRRPLFP
ncbi:hypothetical protein FHS29_006210 [Saccharothrix tamanrassetensis]|uniref:TIR domain-containing protein n=1 Tax=Saccharothrix tamanrassetensis TaxID=1051531 RepID=A0A841CQL9_9PSEU|nr:toll/interleukin-1 receptor domain-containing protein [Saccharothrix tamanrassetensis]MBB5959589.1 hypothetical protein [Saccharothrix tamanrassetensis]